MANRLVVELGDRNYETLTRISERDEHNKTTVTNRAVALYGLVTDHQRDGWLVQLTNPTTGEVKTLVLLS